MFLIRVRTSDAKFNLKNGIIKHNDRHVATYRMYREDLGITE